MPHIEIKHLFNYNRLPDSTQKLLALLIYLPFGVILVTLRVVLGLLIFIIGHILPDVQVIRSILSKLLCFTFGILVNVTNKEKKEDVEAFVSNQISIFDHLVVHTATNSVTPGVKLNSLLSSIFGIQNFGSAANFETFKNNILDLISNNKEPLYFQPESTITNGKALIKFNTWPFSICTKIQPITIKVYRPVLDIAITTASGTYWTNFFFYLFCPCTIYKVEYLSPSEKKGLTDGEFAEKIRHDIAASLKADLVEYTATDLKEWQKRYRIECQQPRPTRTIITNTLNPELNRMALQIRDVLPHVPYNVIYRDLMRTKNVDVTITNLLEGHVVYTPEIPQASTSTASATTSKQSVSESKTSANPVINNVSRDILCTAASTFGKTAQERMLSYQERKQLLIENSRKRYIEKHGLQDLLLNC